MQTTAVVMVLVLICGVGVYIAVTNLAAQYMVVPGGSHANAYACAPVSLTVHVGQSVKFNSSIPEGTPYYWSAPGATSSFVVSGPLTAQYNRAGIKTAFLFYVINEHWCRTSCSLEVQ